MIDLRLAPMAAVTNVPFRLIARECGAGLLTSEEIDARGVNSIPLRGSGKPGFMDALEALGTYPLKDRLEHIECPTLVVWGSKGVIPKWYDAVGIWKDWANDVRGEEIDSGHMLAEEAPDATYQALRRFFA